MQDQAIGTSYEVRLNSQFNLSFHKLIQVFKYMWAQVRETLVRI